jgi:DNA-binding phage protein
MSNMPQAISAVRIRKLWHNVLPDADIASRSQLYSLVPCQIGTVFRESLTGYINRLAETHHVSARALMGEVIAPRLEEQLLPAAPLAVFISQGMMGLNGRGVLGQSCAAILERLTVQTDVHRLTLSWWVGDLSPRRQLRVTPAWCTTCLFEWKSNGYPIYQPLLWMLQMVAICPQHGNLLMERCPHCHKRPKVIGTTKARLGACTHCAGWLGARSQAQHEEELPDELITWQRWLIHALEELHALSLVAGQPQWKPFFRNLARCLKEERGYSTVAHLAGLSRENLHRWVSEEHAYAPTFEAICKFCYACNVTPWQVMTNQLESLQQTIRNRAAAYPPRPRYRHHRVDQERCQALFNEVLDGREAPLGVSEMAKRLGYGVRQLRYYFPQECAVVTLRAREYRKQRKEYRLAQTREQVRQAMLSLHAQGMYPSQRKLRSLLGGLMRAPEARETWHTTLRELGFES